MEDLTPVQHYLADPERWRDLLGYVRLGYGPHRAADAVGSTKRALEAFLSMNPQRNEEYQDARAFFVEGVEGKLHQAVNEGEPWAIATTLKAEAPDKYGAKPAAPSTVVVASAADLERLIALANSREVAPGQEPSPSSNS